MLEGVLLVLLVAACSAWMYELQQARMFHAAMHNFQSASEQWKQAAGTYQKAFDEQRKLLAETLQTLREAQDFLSSKRNVSPPIITKTS